MHFEAAFVDAPRLINKETINFELGQCFHYILVAFKMKSIIENNKNKIL
jgi:hypothetical protein